jgi:hypothetical protein
VVPIPREKNVVYSRERGAGRLHYMVRLAASLVNGKETLLGKRANPFLT